MGTVHMLAGELPQYASSLTMECEERLRKAWDAGLDDYVLSELMVIVTLELKAAGRLSMNAVLGYAAHCDDMIRQARARRASSLAFIQECRRLRREFDA